MIKICKAFSCIATRRKVYWKLGIDSHNDLSEYFRLKNTGNETFCPIEITPKNNNYIEPDKWVFKFDDGCPDWWKQSHEEMCWSAKDEWYNQLMKKVYKNRIKNLIHPFKLPLVKQVTKKDINNLKKWDFIRDSVWDFVRDSVWDSVGDSVWDSVGASIGYSVRDSVGDSVRAYEGFLFKLERNEWKYTDKIKTKDYPFISLIKLWKRGLVPIFDGTTWRLHSGKKAKIVFEIKKVDLK